jgi:hypothetical protein
MSKFPPLSDVLRSIEALKSEIWPAFKDFKGVEEFKTYFHEKFERHFNNQMIYLSAQRDNITYRFYRARPLDSIREIESISAHSYPPPEFCLQNRANLPGHPVFYCSPNPSIALLETIGKNHEQHRDRQYCLSLWKLRNTRKYTVSPFVYDARDELYGELGKTILTKKLSDTLKDSPHNNEEQEESFREILKYLSKAFVHDDDKSYSISSFIGHSHIYMPHSARTELFLYPSNQSLLRGINIAISPKTVDEDLILKYVLILQVPTIALQDNHIGLSVSHYGVCDGKKIDIKPTGALSTGLDPFYEKVVLPEFTITG